MMMPFEWDVRVSSKDHTVTAGYRTRSVGLTGVFRLVGAGKLGSKLVGGNFEGGQDVLVERRLFGLLVRESWVQSWCWHIR